MLRVIENWQPRADGYDVRLEIIRKFQKIARKLYSTSSLIVVRNPDMDRYLRESKDDDANNWHTDCGGTYQTMVVWSSVKPTLIRPVGGPPVEGLKDGDIIVFENTDYEHTTPSGALGSRWFARTTIR